MQYRIGQLLFFIAVIKKLVDRLLIISVVAVFDTGAAYFPEEIFGAVRIS